MTSSLEPFVTAKGFFAGSFYRVHCLHRSLAFKDGRAVMFPCVKSVFSQTLNLFLAMCMFGAPLTSNAQNAEIFRLIREELKAERRGDIEGATQVCLQILKIDERHIQTIATLSGLYGQLDKPAAQIFWARKALAINSRHMAALVSLGNGQAASGQRGDARRSFEKAQIAEPGNPLPHYSLGVLADQMGSTEDAIRHYESALRLDPGLEDAVINLALARDRERQRWGVVEPNNLWR
jgi:tetratricopeptide (TPR) repeat protein